MYGEVLLPKMHIHIWPATATWFWSYIFVIAMSQWKKCKYVACREDKFVNWESGNHRIYEGDNDTENNENDVFVYLICVFVVVDHNFRELSAAVVSWT